MECTPCMYYATADSSNSRTKNIVANLALEINLKLSGKNHLVTGAGLPTIDLGATMIVGIDVTHLCASNKYTADSNKP